MAFKDPFQDINRVLGGAVAQRLDPRNKLIEFKLQEQQNELRKREMVSDFISNAEIDVNNPQSLANFLKDLTVLDQRYAQVWIGAQQTATKFSQQQEVAKVKRKQVTDFAKDIEGAGAAGTPGGAAISEGEEAQLMATALGRGDVESAKLIKGTGINAAARLKSEQELQNLFSDTPSPAEQRQQLNTLIRIEKAMRSKSTQEDMN